MRSVEKYKTLIIAFLSRTVRLTVLTVSTLIIFAKKRIWKTQESCRKSREKALQQEVFKNTKRRLKKKAFYKRLGIDSKTPLEFFQTLALPVFGLMLALIQQYANEIHKITEQEQYLNRRTMEEVRFREQILSEYIDDMKALLLEEDFPNQEHESVARIITISTLERLKYEPIIIAPSNFSRDFNEMIKTTVGRTKRNVVLVLQEADTISASNILSSLGNPDLSYSNLRGLNLSNLDLRNANFSNAELQGTIFRDSNLEDVDFSSSDLTRASFGNSTLSRARFFSANLSGVDFQNSTGLNVSDLDSSGNILCGTIMPQGNVNNKNCYK